MAAKLVYKPCRCIKRGDCFLPGTRGHLYLVTSKRTFPVSRCRYCRRKDDRL